MNPFDEIDEKSRHWALREEGIDITYESDFLSADDANRLFEALKTEIDWERHVIQTPGGPKTVPRMTSWHADGQLSYSYSGLTHAGKAWTPSLGELRGRVAAKMGADFNGVLANFYESERDSVSPHSDDEHDLEEGAPIVSVSLGETREFVVRHRQTRARHVIPLTHGSLLVMAGDTQKVSTHAVPKAKTPCGARINLTFRRMRRQQG